MNIEKLIPYILSIVIGAAAIGKIDDLQIWIIKAQAKVLYESRSSNWGTCSQSKFDDISECRGFKPHWSLQKYQSLSFSKFEPYLKNIPFDSLPNRRYQGVFFILCHSRAELMDCPLWR